MLQCMRLLGIEDAGKLLSGHSSMLKGTGKESREKAEQRCRASYDGAVARCYKSLAFQDMMAREVIIASPDDETCRWLFDTEEFTEWCTNYKSLLWLKGKSRLIGTHATQI